MSVMFAKGLMKMRFDITEEKADEDGLPASELPAGPAQEENLLDKSHASLMNASTVTNVATTPRTRSPTRQASPSKQPSDFGGFEQMLTESQENLLWAALPESVTVSQI
jgi:hypothetical protein